MARINRNPALNTSFKLEIPGLERLNYFVQTAPLPGLSMPGVETPYKNYSGSVPSNRIEYDPLMVTFIMDEDFENHSALHLWMQQYVHGNQQLADVHKDIVLHVLNSNKQPMRSYVFYKAYPTSLEAVQLESSTSDSIPVTCNATFRYQFYDRRKNDN